MHKAEYLLGKQTNNTVWDIGKQMDHRFPARIPDLLITNNWKIPCHLVGFSVQVKHKVKTKEGEKINKFLDLARELKKVRYIKVTVILIVVCISVTGSKSPGRKIELKFRGRIETIEILSVS